MFFAIFSEIRSKRIFTVVFLDPVDLTLFFNVPSHEQRLSLCLI